MRNTEFEGIIAEAIVKKVRVLLRYEAAMNERTFEPAALYYSTKDRLKVNVSGVQVRDSAKPNSPISPRVFEVAKISKITLTSKEFKPDPRFNRLDKMYANGIISYVKVI